MAAAAVWRLAPGRYLAIPDGDEVVVLPLGGLTRIGRRATSDIVLDDSTVSRRHALVLDRGGAPVIADDRSLNGVFVNGQRVREAPLHHGDEVRIGDRLMRYWRFACQARRSFLALAFSDVTKKASKAGLALPSASRSPQS